MRSLDPDVVVIGGGVGGCAAALALCRSGYHVVLTEETGWIGGQLTSQMVPPDEHGWIEQFGCTASYRRFRDGVRQYYRDYYPLLPPHREDPRLNPGNAWVSPLCHEPGVALAVLEAMLAPEISRGRLLVLRHHVPVGLDLESSDRVRSIDVENLSNGSRCRLRAQYFLDATENGDLLPMAGAEYVTGSESRRETGEPNAPDRPEPGNVQAFSTCFVLEERAGESHIIDPPASYDFWRSYLPKLTPPWPGPLLSWEGVNPRTMEARRYEFDPHGEDPSRCTGLWSYRRIIDRTLFEPGFFTSDLCLVNWPMIDYMEANLLDCSVAERTRRLARGRELSLSAIHWLQTEAPRPDGGQGWPGLRLRGDLAGTPDGLAMAPYIRESRRIKTIYLISEQDVSARCRPRETFAAPYEDSVGIGHYRIDLHPTTGGDNYIDIEALPFQIPLGALIPVRMENLIPSAKNIGTTHITNGCYRLHPVEWNIGESAGLLVAFCLDRKKLPREVRADAHLLEHFQQFLQAEGVELVWPGDLDLHDGDPHRHMTREPSCLPPLPPETTREYTPLNVL